MNFSKRLSSTLRPLAIATVALAAIGSAQAQSHHGGGGRGPGGAHFAHPGGHPGYGGHFAPRHGYGHYAPRYRYYGRGPGWGWGGVGLGLGLGWGLSSYYDGYPGYVAVQPNVVYDNTPRPVPLVSSAVPAQSQRPVIYPRNGQGAAQIDSDSNQCSEWAGKQPDATADPSVFRRAIEACMDARGYTLR
jgi:hypothetical protein